MTELPDPPPAEPSAFHRDRREHPGPLERLNDDQLAELAEEERVDAGLDPYDPDEVPPATDDPVPTGHHRVGAVPGGTGRDRAGEGQG